MYLIRSQAFLHRRRWVVTRLEKQEPRAAYKIQFYHGKLTR